MWISRRVSSALLLLAAPAAADVRQPDMQARLLTPIASYSKAGTPFRLQILGSLSLDAKPALPVGTVIHGSIRRAVRIGTGLKRERAALELGFDHCELPDGSSIACSIRLLSVDNARETVRENQVKGVLAASHPHSWLSGMWFRPAPALFRKSPVGLTGAGGVIYSRLAPSPIAALAIIASRLILFRLPDSDIEFPAGTDFVLKMAEPVQDYSLRTNSQTEFPREWAAALAQAPADILLADRTRAADVVNFAFAATWEELTSAFERAGWTTAETLTPKTMARTYRAFASMKTYSKAPVSPLYYQGRTPDLVFQKSFNTLAKRHHIRLWRTEVAGVPVWLGAATHDVAIAFDWNRMNLTHRIDPLIDRERSTVLNDLAAAGCVGGWSVETRTQLAQRAGESGASISTDGSLAIVQLQSCRPREQAQDALLKPRQSTIMLAARRLILESRHYITRGNAYYWGYRTVRWGMAPKRSSVHTDE